MHAHSRLLPPNMRVSLFNVLMLALVLMVHVWTATSASLQDSFVASAQDVQQQVSSHIL